MLLVNMPLPMMNSRTGGMNDRLTKAVTSLVLNRAPSTVVSARSQLPETAGNHDDDRRQQQEICIDQDDDKEAVREGPFKPPEPELQHDGDRGQEHERQKVEHWLEPRLLFFMPGRHGRAEYQKDTAKASS
jgi:hypothetical protein